jgi:hypothetical protein
MTHEEAVSKAIRLLKLAQSDNPHEAASAAAKAQEIIDRYKLTGIGEGSEIPGASAPEEEIRDFENPLESTSGNLARWRVALASTLARANQSQIYLLRVYNGSRIQIVGRPSDAETIRYLYQYLVNEIERLTKVHAKGNGKTWANNFRLGIVEEIGSRLREQREATVEQIKIESPSAIVRVDQSLARLEAQSAQVKEWMKENLKLRQTYARSSFDSSAREAGRRAGQSIQLGGGKGLTSGARALGSGKC